MSVPVIQFSGPPHATMINHHHPSRAPALLWKNLSVYEPNRSWFANSSASKSNQNERRILKSLNGAIAYKSLTAIMGPSGAGKTTLLKCLFGTSAIKYSGQLFVGDKSTRAVFITQNEEDHLLLNLTVEESLQFASKVKNSSSISCCCMSKCLDSDLVQSLIEQLDLERCRHTLVSKCSGGQKKRLAIAQELAADSKPKIIFMDEPTSGIDSSVSYLVLKQLQSLSQRSGIAIVATIHQPSYKILELFDQLYILSRRGKAIYQGRPSYLRSHLLRYSLSCPDGHNPADVVIELASTETTKPPNAMSGCFAGLRRTKAQGIVSTITVTMNGDRHSTATSHESSDIKRIETLEKVAEIECEEIVSSLMSPSLFEVRKLCNYRVARSFCHIWTLFKRSFVNSVLREQRWLFIRLVLHLLVAFLLSFLYDNSIGEASGCLDMNGPPGLCSCSPQKTLEDLRSTNLTGKNVAFLFFNLMFLMFAALMPTVLTFPAEIKVFLNEHRNGWYNTRSYYWAKSAVEFLVQLPLPYLYSMYMYWWTNQIGLDSVDDIIPFLDSSRFKRFAMITLLATFVAQGVGFLIGALFSYNFNISIFVSTIFMLFNFLFSGFFIRISQMGSVEFLTKFSFTRFAFEAILLTIYGDDRCGANSLPIKAVEVFNFTTMANEISEVTTSMFEDVTTTVMANASEVVTKGPAFISTVLYQFDVDEDVFTSAIIWLIIHLIGWRLLTYLTLWWQVNPDSTQRKLFWTYFHFKKCSTQHCLTVILCVAIAMVTVFVLLFVFGLPT